MTQSDMCSFVTELVFVYFLLMWHKMSCVRLVLNLFFYVFVYFLFEVAQNVTYVFLYFSFDVAQNVMCSFGVVFGAK